MVEILYEQNTMVLRARGSDLLIIPAHVERLHALKDIREFAQYFLNKALVNRPARKLFSSWLRKEPGLWQRVFKTIHHTENQQEKPLNPSPYSGNPDDSNRSNHETR